MAIFPSNKAPQQNTGHPQTFILQNMSWPKQAGKITSSDAISA